MDDQLLSASAVVMATDELLSNRTAARLQSKLSANHYDDADAQSAVPRPRRSSTFNGFRSVKDREEEQEGEATTVSSVTSSESSPSMTSCVSYLPVWSQKFAVRSVINVQKGIMNGGVYGRSATSLPVHLFRRVQQSVDAQQQWRQRRRQSHWKPDFSQAERGLAENQPSKSGKMLTIDQNTSTQFGNQVDEGRRQTVRRRDGRLQLELRLPTVRGEFDSDLQRQQQSPMSPALPAARPNTATAAAVVSLSARLTPTSPETTRRLQIETGSEITADGQDSRRRNTTTSRRPHPGFMQILERINERHRAAEAEAQTQKFAAQQQKQDEQLLQRRSTTHRPSIQGPSFDFFLNIQDLNEKIVTGRLNRRISAVVPTGPAAAAAAQAPASEEATAPDDVGTPRRRTPRRQAATVGSMVRPSVALFYYDPPLLSVASQSVATERFYAGTETQYRLPQPPTACW